ncbi:MAG: hypothetical protein J6B28_05010 [Eubacterium sp.]|nr:hypothetical protein [Eubacterium sp.]
MKKGIIKAVVLLCTFMASLVIFGHFTNQNSINLTTEMRAATYPVLSVYYKDYLVGELHGYRDKMDMTTMRDCVVPIQDDRAIAVDIRTFGRTVDEIRYEIRSLDGERLIAERVCEALATNDEILHMDLTLENLLEESEEYQLLFVLASGDDTMYYYTRLMQNPDVHMDDYLDFVNQFHADSMNKENAEKLSTYLEPDASVDNNNLNLVTINSSLQEVAWGEFACDQLTEAVLTIAELNASYAVMTLDYVLTATGAGGELEYYNAQEYYRVSYNEEGKRCYLHNFERRVDQIFRADGENFSENYILLGIRDQEVEYKKSENGQITCFVQQGELWGYNEENGTLYRIFSFRGYEGMDIRENYGAHDIKILGIHEGGSVDFAVYGYMNRGIHEGQVGVSVCHFDSTAATVEEVLFLRSDKSYDRLKTDMGGVLYENAEGILYCMLEGCIYRINVAEKSVKTLAEGLSSESYCVSLDHHLLVWQQDYEQNKDLTVVDLEKERTSIIKSENNERLYPIGFLEDDFVYGIANAGVQKLTNGITPMNRVVIYNVTSGENLKEYGKEHYYITEVSIEDYVITMQRIKRLGEEYISAEPDTILNHAGEDILDDNICREYDEIKQMQIKIRLEETATHTAANVVTSKEVLLDVIPELVLEPEKPWTGYYTYAKGSCQSFHSDLKDAIATADAQMGVVVDRTQKAIWKRAKKLVCAPLELPEEFDEKEMQALYPQAQSLQLTGCMLTQTLYYVSEGIPVEITQEDGTKRYIVGYDSANIWLYDKNGQSPVRMSLAEAKVLYDTHDSRYRAFLY